MSDLPPPNQDPKNQPNPEPPTQAPQSAPSASSQPGSWQADAGPAPQLRPGYAAKLRKQPGGFSRGFGSGMGFALGLGVVLIVSSILSGLIFLGMLAVSLKDVQGDAATTLKTIWGNSSAEGRLRAISISGPILADASDGSVLSAGTYGYEVADMIRSLDKDDSAGLILLMNTPGGSIPGSAAIADAVSDYKERTGQKVMAHVSSMSASGGVYSTSSADEIWADEGSLVGSIGVISGPFQRYTNVTALGSTLLEAGVTAEKIEQEYLSAGKGKAFGDPFVGMSDEQKAKWMEGINASYDKFVQRMVEGRGMDEKVIREEMGAGMFNGEKAVEYKLINGVKNRDEFFRYAAEQAGLDPSKTKVEMVAEDLGFLGGLLGVQRAYGQAPAAKQGEGVVPQLSQAICSRHAILAYHGAPTTTCG